MGVIVGTAEFVVNIQDFDLESFSRGFTFVELISMVPNRKRERE